MGKNRNSIIHRSIGEIIKICLSLGIAILILNVICFMYYKRPGVYNRDTNATSVVHRPGGCLVSSTEGRGINYVDSSGYFNFDKPLSKDGYMFIHPDPEQQRSITIREAACLMSFPMNFQFLGSTPYNYQMIGNAVPVNFAKAIATALYKYLDKTK